MPQETVPCAADIIEAFTSKDSEQSKKLIARCPFTSMTESAIMASASDIPGMNVQALDFLAMGYSMAGPWEYGEVFGKACYQLGRAQYESGKCGESCLLGAGRGAISWMTSLQQVGRHRE